VRTAVGSDVLDCSRPGTLAFWFIVGAALGITVMSLSFGGRWSSLLHVGSSNPLLHKIESELGAVSTPEVLGDDGQFYYLIARDPLGTRGTPRAIAQLDGSNPRYRYRRILFPLLAGGFGELGARATLGGMIVWLAVAMGLAMIAIADLFFQFNERGPLVIVATANAGALLSLLILTADALALALALGGISLALRSRTSWAVAAFALAALTKEVYLLVPWALAAWARRERQRGAALSLAVLPVLPLVAWSGWIAVSVPAAPGADNLGVPLVGLFEAVPIWVRYVRNPMELFMLTFVGLMFAAAIVMVAVGRSGVLRWLVVPWLILGCVSTSVVWETPHTPARIFAILWPLSILLLSEWLSDRRKRIPAS